MENPTKKRKTERSKFIVYTDDLIKAKQIAGKNKNTTKTEERADRAFQKFLTECGEQDTDYWNFTEPDLDSFLSKFWFGARKDPDKDYESNTDDPEKQSLMYSANTMRSFRYSLNCILKSKGHEYDIMNKHSLSFKKSQQAYLDSQKELKALGKAEVHSAPEITEDGKNSATSILFPLLFPKCKQNWNKTGFLSRNFLWP